MIHHEKIAEVEKEIKAIVEELYKKAEENSPSLADFILFLENGHKTNRLSKEYLPFVIGPGEEFHEDKYRIEFYIEYLRSADVKRHQKLLQDGEIDDLPRFQRFSLFLELMIYSHLWENSRNLRILKQLSNLIAGGNHKWETTIPEYGKSKFIRKEIRDVFKEHGLRSGDLINDIYISQIRNAFAHSQFSFMPSGDTIVFHNKDNQYNNLKRLSTGKWEDYFLRSTLFFHELIIKKDKLRKLNGGKNPIVKIFIPIKPSTSRQYEIFWHKIGEIYSFNPPDSEC